MNHASFARRRMAIALVVVFGLATSASVLGASSANALGGAEKPSLRVSAKKTKKPKKSIPPTTSKTQAVVANQFAVIFTGRENYTFRTDPGLEATAASALSDLNKKTGNAFVGFAARIMTRSDTTGDLAFVNGFIANQSQVNATFLQGVVDSAAGSWTNRETLKVANRGIAVIGVDEQSRVSAALAVDAFMFIVYGKDRDSVLAAVRIVGANLGVAVTAAN